MAKTDTNADVNGAAPLDSAIAGCLEQYSCQRKGVVIKAEAGFVFPEDFPAFKGHFPSIPVLPGIIELYAVRYLTSVCLGVELQPVASDHIKFNNRVSPGEPLLLSLELSPLQEGFWKNRFRFTGGGRKISSGIITLSELWS